MLVRQLVVVVAGLAVLAACGGGSSGSDEAASTPAPTADTSTAPPPEKDLTIDDLTAAMPRPDDVPSGADVSLACPKDGADRCGAGDQDVPGSTVVISVDGGATADRELAGEAGNYVAVRAQLYPTADAAAAQLDLQRRAADARDGAFDIAPQDAEGTAIPGEKGTGTVEPLEIAEWTGHALDQSIVPEEDGARVAALSSERAVVRGAALVTVTAVLTAGERADDASAALADDVLEAYLGALA